MCGPSLGVEGLEAVNDLIQRVAASHNSSRSNEMSSRAWQHE